jgi:riboflavin kinase/FMN adenylyltransferase
LNAAASSRIQEKAKAFAERLPLLSFYTAYGDEALRSDLVLETSSQLAACRERLRSAAGNLGHGVKHSEAVARDAGILVQAEAARRGIPASRREELILAVQIAAFLHDIRRAECEHAEAGAKAATDILREIDVAEAHKPRIVTAIRNHEAFKPTLDPPDELGRLISDVLYDADKFRWGPDNFTHTLWNMWEAAGSPPLEKLHRRFLKSLDTIRSIKTTFRTETGRRYGPEFIDQGIDIGHAIFRELTKMVRSSKMGLVTDLEKVKALCHKKGVVTLGNFDGLHRGHQKLINSVVERATEIDGTSIVFTFHPHPLKILSPDACPPLISIYQEKVSMFEEFGIDILLMMPFTSDFSDMAAYDFSKRVLRETLNATDVFVGFNYRFGRDREGTVDQLKVFGKEFGFQVTEVGEVAVDGEVISSTKIRDLLKAGNMEHAARLLGRNYAITGRVAGGDRRGRELGFPTANVDPYHEIMPYPGVYAVRVLVDGQLHDGVANAGFRPTFDKHEMCLEAHIFDFAEDIYGKEITVSFVAKLRDEKRFDSLDALVKQMHQDAATAKSILARGA